MLMIITFGLNALINFALGLGVAYYLGAAEFGVFALAVAGGAVLQTVIFEWLRMAANRYYGEKQAAENPAILATLNLATGLAAIVLSVTGVILYFTGASLGLSATVAAMAPLTAISGGLFDYRCAVARAAFDMQRYARTVIVKNVAALVLMLGGAWWFCRADMVLIGLCLSALSGVAATARFGREKDRTGLFDAALLGRFALYSAPMVVSSLVFQLNMFMTRSTVAVHYGLSESGRYSLALDIGLKLVATIGSALDILLFQLAVRAEAEKDASAARAQLSRNLAIVTAVLLPLCVGFWMILPSFEALFVGASYAQAYSSYTLHLLPGLFAFGLAFYAINPIFQIAQKTWPVLVSAAANILVAAAVLFLIPGTSGRHGANATSAGFIAATLLMILLASRLAPIRVPWTDLARTAAATLALALALLPLRSLPPGFTTLLLSCVAGGLAYGFVAVALDIAGLRGLIRARLRPAAA